MVLTVNLSNGFWYMLRGPYARFEMDVFKTDLQQWSKFGIPTETTWRSSREFKITFKFNNSFKNCFIRSSDRDDMTFVSPSCLEHHTGEKFI